MRFWSLLFICLFCVSAHARIYLTVTGASVKKAKIAVGRVHPLPGTAVDPQLTKNIAEQLRKDLEFTDLFEFLPESLYADLDTPQNLYNAKYDDWTAKGTAFVLKIGHKIEAGKLVLEALLYDIPGQKKVFGTRYQYPLSQYYRVVHAVSEDILKELTGERGLFFSRVLMVCREGRRGANKEIYVADADGRNLTALTSDNTLSLSPNWSPDAKQVLYTQYANIGRSRKRGTLLKRHNLASGDRKVISAREGMNSGAAWTANGNRIAVTLSFNGRPEIYLLNPNGTGEPDPLSRNIQLRRISGEGFQPNYESLLFDVEPSWSPDGTKIVFSSARSGNPMIYTVDVNSKIANQLTFAGKYNATPDWSPKGDKILFAAQRVAEGNFDLYVIDPDGNNLNRVTNGDRAVGRRVNSENPSWAPTGRHLVFAANEGGMYAVYTMTLDGGVKRKISPEGKECSEPTWGPPEG